MDALFDYQNNCINAIDRVCLDIRNVVGTHNVFVRLRVNNITPSQPLIVTTKTRASEPRGIQDIHISVVGSVVAFNRNWFQSRARNDAATLSPKFSPTPNVILYTYIQGCDFPPGGRDSSMRVAAVRVTFYTRAPATTVHRTRHQCTNHRRHNCRRAKTMYI